MGQTSILWDSGLFCPLEETHMIPEIALHWRHNDHNGVSNHQPHGGLLNLLFRRRSKKTSKLHFTGLCVGKSPGPVNSLHKGPVTQKMFPFDDVIMVRKWISVAIYIILVAIFYIWCIWYKNDWEYLYVAMVQQLWKAMRCMPFIWHVIYLGNMPAI